jgi:hypothetical protein
MDLREMDLHGRERDLDVMPVRDVVHDQIGDVERLPRPVTGVAAVASAAA